MAYLVRKIARAKWPEEICSVSDLCGDAISDLKTTANTLSLWRIETEDDLPTAALALSASSKSNSIEGLSLVWIPEEKIRERLISIDENSPGDTIVADLMPLHRDLCSITYSSLGGFADLILNELIQEKHYRRYTKGQMKTALAKAYNDKRISEEKCLPELLCEIKKAAASVK